MSNDVEVVVPKPVIVDEHYNTRAEWLRFEVIILHVWILFLR